MSSTEGRMVYEIREGSEVLGQFSAKTKAVSFRRECSSEGRKVRIVTRFVKDSGMRPELRPAPKKEPKPRKAPSPAVPKAIPKPRFEAPATVSGRTLKSLSKLFKPLGISGIPVYSSSFFVVDPAHVAMIGVSTPDGGSVFGLDGSGPADVRADLIELAGRCSASSVYRVREEGALLVLDDGKDSIPAGLTRGNPVIRRPNLSMGTRYDVDLVAFDAELRRVKGILNGGRISMRSEPSIRLHGSGGDLMMSERSEGYGFRADVGDGDEGGGSSYPYSCLKVLADMFLLSDSPCTLAMDEDYPLEGGCSMGGLGLTMLMAPMREE